MTASHDYDDIIDLPHHVSRDHAQMSMLSRAAQFSPFAALTGYDAAVEETARITDSRVELGEDEKAKINAVLVRLKERARERPRVSVTCFVPDPLKAGGAYVTLSGEVKKVDDTARRLTLADGAAIGFDDIAVIVELK